MNDNLGNRMKEKFENRSKFFLPRRCPVIIRVDAKLICQSIILLGLCILYAY